MIRIVSRRPASSPARRAPARVFMGILYPGRAPRTLGEYAQHVVVDVLRKHGLVEVEGGAENVLGIRPLPMSQAAGVGVLCLALALNGSDDPAAAELAAVGREIAAAVIEAAQDLPFAEADSAA